MSTREVLDKNLERGVVSPWRVFIEIARELFQLCVCRLPEKRLEQVLDQVFERLKLNVCQNQLFLALAMASLSSALRSELSTPP